MPETSKRPSTTEARRLTTARSARRALAAVLPLALLAPAARAQRAAGAGRWADAVQSWIALDAPTGYERYATDSLLAALPGWRRDEIGSLILRRGSGAPRRVVACALDQASYVVSEITDDGYLRLHMDGRAVRSPLWDQFHEGQRIRVLGAHGAVPGVVAVRSVHLWRRGDVPTAPVSMDELWVDVGARSARDVAQLGIRMLDPVQREWPAWRFADLASGPGAATRAGCAAVAAAAALTPARGETVFVLEAQSAFGHTGLQAVLHEIGGADSVVLVDPALARPDSNPAEAVSRRALRLTPALGIAGARGLSAIGVRSWFRGTLVESVRDDDARQLFAAVAAAAGERGAPAPIVVRDPVPTPPAALGRDSLADVAELLGRLTNVYAVSEHEAPMRDAIRAELPGWARARVTEDTAGNLIIPAGPDRDTVVFIAHMDEVGFEVASIARDGVVTLRPRGGFFRYLWEGQPALLHFDVEPRPVVRTGTRALPTPRREATDLRGVFVPREVATTREPAEVTAWFGLDSAALVARGVHPGLTVTGYKSATRLAGVRFTNRAIDDRAGCTALLLAMRALDPSTLRHKVIFVFSTREETALAGAAAAAAELGTSVRRVHAVDTFVSSDSPLESPRFALAPIGRGAVVRAIDNSSVTPPDEVQRMVAIAGDARIPVQVGTTNGGNDGSEFARHGVLDVPLSWPLRYSHSPAEVIDLADIRALGQLVAAVARADVPPPPAPPRLRTRNR